MPLVLWAQVTLQGSLVWGPRCSTECPQAQTHALPSAGDTHALPSAGTLGRLWNAPLLRDFPGLGECHMLLTPLCLLQTPGPEEPASMISYCGLVHPMGLAAAPSGTVDFCGTKRSEDQESGIHSGQRLQD